jgi:hypothetical protein
MYEVSGEICSDIISPNNEYDCIIMVVFYLNFLMKGNKEYSSINMNMESVFIKQKYINNNS